MQADNGTQVQSGINVTPLVDVVLVLLIIFMIIAPQLQVDASVEVPTTERPPDKPQDARQIVVVLDADGGIEVEGEATPLERLPERLQAIADGQGKSQVVLKGDARLTFGHVQRAMYTVERAGFADVGLIARRAED